MKRGTCVNLYSNLYHISKNQCQRICLYSSIVMDCECIHPLYVDFDALRNVRFANISRQIETCNLIMRGMHEENTLHQRNKITKVYLVKQFCNKTAFFRTS